MSIQAQYISKNRAEQLLNRNLQSFIVLKEKNKTEAGNPWDYLLNPKRFDILIKYIYAYYRERGLKTNWGIELYDEHIRAFNNYIEDDESNKNGIEMFLCHFHNVLDSIKDRGFNKQKFAIPIGSNGVPSDGAHRIAAAALYNVPIQILHIDKEDCYDYRHFRSKGLGQKWMDATALEFCRLNKNTYIVNIFPSAIGKGNEIQNILNQVGEVYYEKEIYLRGWGPTYYIKQIYNGEPWVGERESAYSGAHNKAQNCFKGTEPLRVYVLVVKNPKLLIAMKQEIRELFNIGNHSIHINDTHDETISMAEILFNENSLHFLNHVKHSKFNRFSEYLDQLTESIDSSGMDKGSYCVDGSSVMSAYGIREGEDMDYLHASGVAHIDELPDVNSHNTEIRHYETTVDNIIYNPDNHFYYMGIKFVSLSLIKNMKIKRGEEKDLLDVKLIESHLRNKILLQIEIWVIKLRRRQYILRNRIVASIKRRFKSRW